MPDAFLERLRAHGFVPPDLDGGSLLNVAGTALDVLGARGPDDPVPLRALDPALRDGVRQVVVVLADGLGTEQLERLCARGDTPFVASLIDRASRQEAAQLIGGTTIFPSTTAAAITTMHTARTPQEHGNLAYFVWLDEFRAVAQMLRWGRATSRRGSFFDDPRSDPLRHVKVPSVHARFRRAGVTPYVVEPEVFRKEAMTRMHAREAEYVGYVLPTTLAVRVRELLDARPWGAGRAYIYAYWSGIDAAAHEYGPGSEEEAAEAASLDLNLRRAFGDRGVGDTLVILTADHGHAAVDPDLLMDLEADGALRALLRNPIAGEPRLVFLHTDHPQRVIEHLESRWPGAFFCFAREDAIAAGLFGHGDPSLVRRRVGEVCAMPIGPRGAAIVRVEGQLVLHRGSHGGMTPAEMDIPIVCWRA